MRRTGWHIVIYRCPKKTSTMYMLCCMLKIIYYLGLIAYHGCDVCFDLFIFHKLVKDNTVSGVLISTNSSLFHTGKIFFGISCATGTSFSIIMIVAYGSYIKFHWYCIHHANYRPARYSDGKCSIFSDRGCDKKCNRTFVTLELWVSVLELFLKDDIQSGILFWIYTSHSIETKPDWQFIVFQACSVVAHLKLCICFLTKLCGCGAGEECCDGSCCKILASVIGLIGFVIGSAVFLCLTVVSLVEAVKRFN